MLKTFESILTSSIVLVTLLVVSVFQMSVPEFSKEGEWNIYVVDCSGYAGEYSSLELDSNDYPHISYLDRGNAHLKYARWNGSAWIFDTASSHVGSDISLALDSKDYPHISYLDAHDRDVSYVSWNGSAWNNEIVEPVFTIGSGTSIGVDGNDNLHISYYDDTDPYNGDLKYAKRIGGHWINETVDSTGYVGWSSSIALDSKNYPHISYVDNVDVDNRDLKYAKWNGSSWNVEIVDSGGKVGTFSSMAIDSYDNPHISYFDDTNDDLKYAKWNGSSWNVETVDHTWRVVGKWSSIDLDSYDYPHISYHDASYINLKYAAWNGSAWDIELVESYDLVGYYTSIGIDSNNKPHISYHDGGNNALKFATKADLSPPSQPVLSYSPGSLVFGDLVSGAIARKTFEIWNSGSGSLTYSISESIPWVTEVDPMSGSSTGERDIIEITVDTGGLPVGYHSDTVLIASNGGNESVEISLNVSLLSRSVSLDFDPDTLNIKSNGRWITAFLLTDNAFAEDIEASSLLLNDLIVLDRWIIQNETTLVVKFNRLAVQSTLSMSGTIDVRITGLWKDGEIFVVHDSIRVISPGQ